MSSSLSQLRRRFAALADHRSTLRGRSRSYSRCSHHLDKDKVRIASSILSAIETEIICQTGTNGVANVARHHGYDIIRSETALLASGWYPYAAFRGSDSDLIVFLHGTKLTAPRQVITALRGTVIGGVTDAFYFEALAWVKQIVKTTAPRRIMFAGFSQGGTLSEMLLVHLTGVSTELPYYVKELCAVSFDSPSFPLDKFLQTVHAKTYCADAILQIKSAPNCINTSHSPVGKDISRVMIPHVEDYRFDESELAVDATDLLTDIVPMVATEKGMCKFMVGTGMKVYCKSWWSYHCWLMRQHNMELIDVYLSDQRLVITWPTHRQYANYDWVGFAMAASMSSWNDVAPIVGPSARLMEKLHAIHSGTWKICRDRQREALENYVLSIEGFSQHSE